MIGVGIEATTGSYMGVGGKAGVEAGLTMTVGQNGQLRDISLTEKACAGFQAPGGKYGSEISVGGKVAMEKGVKTEFLADFTPTKVSAGFAAGGE